VKVQNNDNVAHYLFYKVNGGLRKELIKPLSSVILHDLTSRAQIVRDLYHLKVHEINDNLSRNLTEDLSITETPNNPSLVLAYANQNFPFAEGGTSNDWNTAFQLPTYGNSFSGISIEGDSINLYSGSNINLLSNVFAEGNLNNITDNAGSIKWCQDGCFSNTYSLKSISLPALLTAGTFCFSINGGYNLDGFNVPLLNFGNDYW